MLTSTLKVNKNSHFEHKAYPIADLIISAVIILHSYMLVVCERQYYCYGPISLFFPSQTLSEKNIIEKLETIAQSCPFPELPLYFLSLTLTDKWPQSTEEPSGPQDTHWAELLCGL